MGTKISAIGSREVLARADSHVSIDYSKIFLFLYLHFILRRTRSGLDTRARKNRKIILSASSRLETRRAAE